jgi:hypothetical protein
MRLLDDSGVDFTPFTIPIVLETKEEAERFHALFNYHPVVKWLKVEGCDNMASDIRHRIQSQINCGNHVRFTEIQQALG